MPTILKDKHYSTETFFIYLLLYLGDFDCLSGAVMVFGMWALPIKNTIPMYVALVPTFLFGWLLELNYRMFQNEADGICDMPLFDGEAPWWTVSIGTVGLQLLYAMYLIQKYDSIKTFKAPIDIMLVAITFLPQLVCIPGIFMGVFAPLYYYLTKVMFALLGFAQICYYYGNSGLPPRKLTQEELGQLNPGKWFMRDMLIGFAMLFYSMCVVIDTVRLTPAGILTLTYLTSFVGDWCTSLVIVLALSATFGFLSNLLVGLSRFLVTGQKEFAAAVFDVNIGHRVNIAMVIFCLEAGLLTVDDETRILNSRSVIFLTVYVILAQVWDMTEQQCHMVANSGETRSTFMYLRVLVFVFTITSIPTLITFKAAAFLSLDIWMLLNASGTIVVLSRAFCSLIELFLGTLAWHVDNHIDKVEDAIYYIRLFKNVTTSVASLMLGYYRLNAPFFSGWYVFRLVLVICEVVGFAKLIVYKEWVAFQNRRKFLKRLDAVPEATEEELRELNDVCSICFAEMNEGKVLQCSHIFHNACLRKWFQLRATCPMCNTAVF